MDYEELTRNVGKAGLTLKQFAHLLKMTPNSITNLKGKAVIPKHIAIIAVLLGEMVDKKVDYKGVLERVDIGSYKARTTRFNGTKNA